MIKNSTAVAPNSTSVVVKVFNTIDRREVATLQVRGGDLHPSKASLLQEMPSLIPTIACFAWSPNGQSVAVVTNQAAGVPGHSSSFVSLFNILAANGTEPLEPYQLLEVEGKVQNAQWCMAGKDPQWCWQNSNEQDAEQQMAWRYQLRYADQALKFLPQSGYVNSDGGIATMDASAMATDHEDDAFMAIPPDEDINTITPKAQNAMTILALTTKNEQEYSTSCELYLNGRLWLGSLAFKTCNEITKRHLDVSKCHPIVVSSHDMTYWLAFSSPGHGNNPSVLSITHMPWIKEKRPQLQQVSASLASIYQNVQTLEQSVVADDWKTSLRRLDQIIQLMVDELKKYGISATTGNSVQQQQSTNEKVLDLGDVIKEYIAAGARADGKSDDEYANVANAMDTFFTKGQLHDRLMERLDESLQTALANVESTVEKFLLRPARAVRVQAVELTRLSLREQNLMDDLSEASDDLLRCIMLLQKRVVHSRSIIKEFCEWLRSSRAMVQSKGTSANPNLKKRRLQPRVLNGLIAVLNSRDTNAGVSSNQPQVGLTESLLNLRVTELLKGEADDNQSQGLTMTTARMQPSLERIQTILNSELKNCAILDECETIQSHDITLSVADPSSIALHTRIGTDIEEEDREMLMDDDEEDGHPECFIPKVVLGSGNLQLLGDLTSCQQWGVVASWQHERIQLFCLPLGWRGSESSAVYNDKIPFYLTVMLSLPQGYSIPSLGFYGDDGKCNLAAGKDGGTGKEGIQQLAILCQRDESLSPELYFTAYDSLGWQAVEGENLQFGSHVSVECCYDIIPYEVYENADVDDTNNTTPAQITALPNNILADEYLLHFSASRDTVLVTSIKLGESLVTHSVLEKKDGAGDEEEVEEEEDDEDEE
jgi:hypothetical protein